MKDKCTNHCVTNTSVTEMKDTYTNHCVTNTSVTEMKDTCTNHCVTNTSVTEMKDTYTNHCVTNTSVTEMKDTCTNHCVTNTSVTEMKDTCTNHCVTNTSVTEMKEIQGEERTSACNSLSSIKTLSSTRFHKPSTASSVHSVPLNKHLLYVQNKALEKIKLKDLKPTNWTYIDKTALNRLKGKLKTEIHIKLIKVNQG